MDEREWCFKYATRDCYIDEFPEKGYIKAPAPVELRNVKVFYLWGPRAAGKRTRVRNLPWDQSYMDEAQPWRRSLRYDVYEGQPILAFCGMDRNQPITFNILLKLIDDHPYLLPVYKHTASSGVIEPKYHTIIITSAHAFEDVFAQDLARATPEELAQIERCIPMANRIHIDSYEQDVQELGLGHCAWKKKRLKSGKYPKPKRKAKHAKWGKYKTKKQRAKLAHYREVRFWRMYDARSESVDTDSSPLDSPLDSSDT